MKKTILFIIVASTLLLSVACKKDDEFDFDKRNQECTTKNEAFDNYLNNDCFKVYYYQTDSITPVYPANGITEMQFVKQDIGLLKSCSTNDSIGQYLIMACGIDLYSTQLPNSRLFITKVEPNKFWFKSAYNKQSIIGYMLRQ